ncbi:MAG: GNAT family N-acetyltransferase [Acetobacteraceae bacterium]
MASGAGEGVTDCYPRRRGRHVPLTDGAKGMTDGSLRWFFDQGAINWHELAELYRIAPLGNKTADELAIAFANSMFKCFVRDNESLVGAGRAVADGIDCCYLCDVAVHPDFQRRGLGREIVTRLMELSGGHKKIILYANSGSEGLYRKFGFLRMRRAMAVFKDPERAITRGLLEKP